MITKGKLLLGLLVVGLPAAAFGVGMFGLSSTGLAPESMRDDMAQDIVQRWSPYVQQTYGKAGQGWAQRMQATFESVDISNLELAASAPTYEQMNAALLGGGTKGMQQTVLVDGKGLGSPGSDLVYTPLVPCRIADTRVVGGALAPNETRSYHGFTGSDFTAQGGSASTCNIPLNASAIAVSITAVTPGANGYLTVFPFNDPKPLATAVNYSTGSITSGQSVIRLCRPGCANEFNVYSLQQSHVVIDVEGFYAEPEATALDCTTARETGTLDLLSGLQPKFVNCPTGYTATGGGCGGPLGIAVSNSEPNVVGGQQVGWRCDLVGSLLSALSYQVNATCCRVPGR
ncbi:hypothetical protein ABU614_20490 [Lysobacter firmicutimachus]|uniref:Uncharacterized protein n=1 Tax=Lysobacter firmicutimachus TaxID=1792846 RepID=A0AAU8MQC5_9GAMM